MLANAYTPLIWLLAAVLVVTFGGTALMRAFRRNLLKPHNSAAPRDQRPQIDPWEESARRMPTPPETPEDRFDA